MGMFDFLKNVSEDSLKDENAKLREELAKMQEKLAKAEEQLAAATLENKQFEERLEKAEERNKEFEKKLEKAELDVFMSDRYQDLEFENAELQEKLEKAEEKVKVLTDKLIEYSDEIKELKEGNKTLSNENNKLEEKLEKAELDAQDARERFDDLDTDFLKSLGRVDQLEKENKSLTEKLAKTELDAQDARESFDNLDADFLKSLGRIDQLEVENKELRDKVGRSEEQIAILSGKVVENSIAEMLDNNGNGSGNRSSGGLETPIADILRDKGITGLDETKLDGAKLKDFPTLITKAGKIDGVGTDGKSASDILVAEYAREAHLTKREVVGLKLCVAADKNIDSGDIIFSADNILRKHCKCSNIGETSEVNLVKASLDSDRTAIPLYGLCIEAVKNGNELIPEDKLGQVVLVGLSERYGNTFTDRCLAAGDDGIKFFRDFLKMNSHSYATSPSGKEYQFEGVSYTSEKLLGFCGISCNSEEDFEKFMSFSDSIYKSMINYDKKYVCGHAVSEKSLLDYRWYADFAKISAKEDIRKGMLEYNEFRDACKEAGKSFARQGHNMTLEDVGRLYSNELKGKNPALCLRKKEAMEAIVAGYKEERQKLADKQKGKDNSKPHGKQGAGLGE